MFFELHAHTHHSTGRKIPCECTVSPKQLVKIAKKIGLNGVAVTDHDNIKAWKEASREAKKEGMIFIPGIEISTRQGHLIGLGLTEYVKPFMDVDETLDYIRMQGAVSVAPHPFDIKGEGLGRLSERVDAIEVFNSLNMDRASNGVAHRYAKKQRKPMVVGSDAHSSKMIGRSMNIIEADDAEGVLNAIRNNRVDHIKRYATVDSLIFWAEERMATSSADILKYIDRNYNRPKAWISRKLMMKFLSIPNIYWKPLAYFGLGSSMAYGSIRSLFY